MADLSNLKNQKPGATSEVNNKGSYEAGLWRHPETGAEAGTLFDPLYGNAQSEAFARLGFKRVGDLPEGYQKNMPYGDSAMEAGAKSATVQDMKGIQARLDALEAENKQLKAEKLASETDTAGESANEVDGSSEVSKPLAAQNRVELEATASALGLGELEQYESKKDLIAAIEAKQAEGSEEGK